MEWTMVSIVWNSRALLLNVARPRFSLCGPLARVGRAALVRCTGERVDVVGWAAPEC